MPAQIASELQALAASAPDDILAMYVFGSEARGDASPSSDIDLGLLLRTGPAATLEGRMLDIETALERALGRPVQTVILNGGPPDLIHRVLRDGRVVLDRDRAARIQFEVHSRNLYFDLLPILTGYRRRALERAAGRQ